MSQPNPKITVITPTYYRPDLLRRTILSVQNQSFQQYEHIIISDHCPHAKLVYDEFKSDKRIKFIENTSPHVSNAGSVGKNIGIENANSNIICYCDDDNVYLPNHLSIKNSQNSQAQLSIRDTIMYH